MTKANYPFILGITCAAALGGLLFGYDTAVISGAVKAINANFIAPRALSEGAKDWLLGTSVGIALLGCVIGAGLAGRLSGTIGRRGGLLVAALLFFVSALGSGFPEFGWGVVGHEGPNALAAFLVYRVLAGIGIGMASMLTPMYIGEIAPPQSRGLLVTIQQIAIVGGINLVYFVNWLIASQGDAAWILSTGWRYMLASAAIPAALLFAFMLLVPDTPRYLVLKGRSGDARKVLNRLTDPQTADTTLRDIEASLAARQDRLFAFGGMVLLVGVLLSVFQQFVGINAVLYYAPQMFENMGSSTNAALLQAVLVGAANTVFTLVAFFTVDRLGRKPLLVAGALIMAAAMLTLGTLFHLHEVGRWAVVAVLVYISGFAMSWGPVVWVLLSEIFPNAIKGKAMAIAVAAQWIANFVVTQTFAVVDGDKVLVAAFNHGFAYWIYGAMSVLAALFVLRYVPETKGRSLEALEDNWQRKTANR
jgi:SP family xylose:H+ symportor-like MFS transporter